MKFFSLFALIKVNVVTQVGGVGFFLDICIYISERVVQVLSFVVHLDVSCASC